MIISLWRYSHLVLAISSFLFVLVASVTGIVLAFEPISNAVKPYEIEQFNSVNLNTTIDVVTRSYNEVIELKVDPNHFVSIDAINKAGSTVNGYINPLTGEFLGEHISKSKVFKVTTNLHRSLFLKSTGRLIVGVISFLLFLIAISGTGLIIKRQLNIKRFFTQIIKDNLAQYWHTALGRLFLIPIILITLTGVYLSMFRFNVFPNHQVKQTINYDELKDEPRLNVLDFEVFKQIPLTSVKSIEFPFSKSVDDFYTIELNNRKIIVNQFTGEIVNELPVSDAEYWANWSIKYHTGQGSIIWSLILLSSCISILFFIYSGFTLTFKRRKRQKIIKNTYSKNNAEYIILVGSETGSTFLFANQLYKALLQEGKTVFVDDLNAYTTYNLAKHLIIITSTYGDGEAPVNANKFIQRFKETKPINPLQYTVVGFGSKAYKHYCKFASDINTLFKTQPEQYIQGIDLYKINNQSFNAFNQWAKQWGNTIGMSLELSSPIRLQSKPEKAYTVISRTPLNRDETFLIRLKPKKYERFESGDLLALTPKEDGVERLYSIGRIDNDILLSIKKHEFGICSNYLRLQSKNDVVKGMIKSHKSFRFPKRAKEVVMISNGTGIAPFLGMINNNVKQIPIHMFWGGRTQESLNLYNKMIKNCLDKNQLSSMHVAYSQVQNQKIYVQDLIAQNEGYIIKTIRNNGVIMICGSVAMQKQVLVLLDTILTKHLNTSVDTLIKKRRIKMDCY